MAKGKFTGGKPFEKGNQHSAKKAHLPEVRAAANITVTTVRARIKEFMNDDKQILKDRVKDEKIPIIDVIISKALLLAADGNIPSLNLILDRAIGKVKEEVEIRLPKPMIIDNLETNQQMLLGAQEVIEGEIEKDHD